mmetsp:Transcript_104378/g.183978  ORF Transcript_104378/g.183978 Transcript_104378/m.183978 type:complete len:203 (-) Transcript_104378:3634-4242(-)
MGLHHFVLQALQESGAPLNLTAEVSSHRIALFMQPGHGHVHLLSSVHLTLQLPHQLLRDLHCLALHALLVPRKLFLDVHHLLALLPECLLPQVALLTDGTRNLQQAFLQLPCFLFTLFAESLQRPLDFFFSCAPFACKLVLSHCPLFHQCLFTSSYRSLAALHLISESKANLTEVLIYLVASLRSGDYLLVHQGANLINSLH